MSMQKKNLFICKMKNIRNFLLKNSTQKYCFACLLLGVKKTFCCLYSLPAASHCLFYLHNIFILESLEILSMPVFLFFFLFCYCSIRDQTVSHTSTLTTAPVVGKCQVSSDGAGVK